MADRHAVVWNISGRFENIQPGDVFRVNEASHFVGNIQVDGLVDGQDIAAIGGKVTHLTVTGAIDLDAVKTKVDYITVTQAVDLDALETRVNALNASVVVMGNWDASTGLFPVSTTAGESWICNVAGTVDTVDFEIGDRVIAITDGASTLSRLDWHQERYNDHVSDVNGKVGSVTLVEADISDLQAYTLPADFDSLSKLNDLCGESLMTTEQIDTLPELNTILTDTDVLGADGSVSTAFQDFDDAAAPAHAEGRLFYDNVNKCPAFYNDNTNITMQLGQESWIRVRNDTGVQIDDGTPVYISGASGGIPQISKATASDGVAGITTLDIADGAIGYITVLGLINDLNLSAYSVGDTLYVDPDTAGAYVTTRPAWPKRGFKAGMVIDNDASAGKLLVELTDVGRRNFQQKSFTFSSRTANSGTYFLGGAYTWADADANLTQASTTVNLGTANHPYGAHAFMVFGAGSTDGTNITITVSGTSFASDGTRTAADSEVLYTGPVAGLSVNDYLETTKKWIGQVTYTLTSDGVNFTCDFNYGFAKYEDFVNNSFTLESFEVLGLFNASDSGFEVEVIHHNDTGWTYAATGFVPGPTPIAVMTTDLSTESDPTAGDQIAWKRTGLGTNIDGSMLEGILFRITTTVNNSVSYLNVSCAATLDV